MARTFDERFWAYVEKGDGCWTWTGPAMGDYGCMMYKRITKGSHRWAYEFLVGEIPDGMLIDHACGNAKCVNPEHLRLATWAENSRNRKQNTAPTKSGVKGVQWNPDKRKWQARIKCNYVNYFLGYYDDIEDAAMAYAEGAKKYHGEFANLGAKRGS